MNDSQLINKVILNKADCINKEAKINDFIDEMKIWNLKSLKTCLHDDIMIE